MGNQPPNSATSRSLRAAARQQQQQQRQGQNNLQLRPRGASQGAEAGSRAGGQLNPYRQQTATTTNQTSENRISDSSATSRESMDNRRGFQDQIREGATTNSLDRPRPRGSQRRSNSPHPRAAIRSSMSHSSSGATDDSMVEVSDIHEFPSPDQDHLSAYSESDAESHDDDDDENNMMIQHHRERSLHVQPNHNQQQGSHDMRGHSNQPLGGGGLHELEVDADTQRVRALINASISRPNHEPVEGGGNPPSTFPLTSNISQGESFHSQHSQVTTPLDTYLDDDIQDESLRMREPESPSSEFSDPDDTVEDITDFPRFGCCIPLSAATNPDPDFVLVPKAQGGAMLFIPPFYEQHRIQQQQLRERHGDAVSNENMMQAGTNQSRSHAEHEVNTAHGPGASQALTGPQMLANRLATQLGNASGFGSQQPLQDQHDHGHQVSFDQVSGNAGLGVAQFQAARHMQLRQAGGRVPPEEEGQYLTPGHHAQHHRVAARAVMRNQIDLRSLPDDRQPLTPEQESMALHYRSVHGLSVKAISKLILVNHRKIFRHLVRITRARYHSFVESQNDLASSSTSTALEDANMKIRLTKPDFRDHLRDLTMEQYEDFYTALRFPRLRHELVLLFRKFTPLPRFVISLIMDFALHKLKPGQPLDVLDDRGKELWYNACIVDVYRVADSERKMKQLLKSAPESSPSAKSVTELQSAATQVLDSWGLLDPYEDDEAFEVKLDADEDQESLSEHDPEEDEDRLKEELQVYLPGNASKHILQALGNEAHRAGVAHSAQNSNNAVALSQLSMQATDSPADSFGIDPAEMFADPIIYKWLQEQDMLDPTKWPKLVCLSAFGMECECNCDCAWLGLSVPCREYQMGTWDYLMASGGPTRDSSDPAQASLFSERLKDARLVVSEPLNDNNLLPDNQSDKSSLQYEELFFETAEFQRHCTPLRSLAAMPMLQERLSSEINSRSQDSPFCKLRHQGKLTVHESVGEFKASAKMKESGSEMTKEFKASHGTRLPPVPSSTLNPPANATGTAAAAAATPAADANDAASPELRAQDGFSGKRLKQSQRGGKSNGSCTASEKSSQLCVSTSSSPESQTRSVKTGPGAQDTHEELSPSTISSAPSPDIHYPPTPLLNVSSAPSSRNSSTPTSPASSASQAISLPSLRHPPRHNFALGGKSKCSNRGNMQAILFEDDCGDELSDATPQNLREMIDSMKCLPQGMYSCRKLTSNERLRLEQRAIAMQYVACRPRRSGHLSDCPFHLFALCRDHIRQRNYERRAQARAAKQAFFAYPAEDTHRLGHKPQNMSSNEYQEAKFAAASMITRLTMKYGSRCGFIRSSTNASPENVSHRGEVLNVPASQTSNTANNPPSSATQQRPGNDRQVGGAVRGILVLPQHPLEPNPAEVRTPDIPPSSANFNWTSSSNTLQPPTGPRASLPPPPPPPTREISRDQREAAATDGSGVAPTFAARLGLGIGGFFGGLAAGLASGGTQTSFGARQVPPPPPMPATGAAGAAGALGSANQLGRQPQQAGGAMGPNANEPRNDASLPGFPLSAHARAIHQRMMHHQLPHQQPAHPAVPQYPQQGQSQVSQTVPSGLNVMGPAVPNTPATPVAGGAMPTSNGVTVSMLPQAYLPPSMRRYRYADEGPNPNLKCDQILVHYLGWHRRWDEWLPVDSHRIAAPRSRTSGRATGPDFAGAKVAPTAAPDVPKIAMSSDAPREVMFSPETQPSPATRMDQDENFSSEGADLMTSSQDSKTCESNALASATLDIKALEKAGAGLTRYLEGTYESDRRRAHLARLRRDAVDTNLSSSQTPVSKTFFGLHHPHDAFTEMEINSQQSLDDCDAMTVEPSTAGSVYSSPRAGDSRFNLPRHLSHNEELQTLCNTDSEPSPVSQNRIRIRTSSLHANALRKFGRPKLDTTSMSPDIGALSPLSSDMSNHACSEKGDTDMAGSVHDDSTMSNDNDMNCNSPFMYSPNPSCASSQNRRARDMFGSSASQGHSGSLSAASPTPKQLTMRENIFSRLPPGYTLSCLGQLVDLSQDHGHFRDLDKYMKEISVQNRDLARRANGQASAALEEATLTEIAKRYCPLHTHQSSNCDLAPSVLDTPLDREERKGEEENICEGSVFAQRATSHGELTRSEYDYEYGFGRNNHKAARDRCVRCECGHMISHVVRTLREAHFELDISLPFDFERLSMKLDFMNDQDGYSEYLCPDIRADPEFQGALDDMGALEDKTMEYEDLMKVKEACYAKLEAKVARGEMPPLQEPAPQLILLQQMSLQQQMMLQMNQQQQQADQGHAQQPHPAAQPHNLPVPPPPPGFVAPHPAPGGLNAAAHPPPPPPPQA